MQPSGDQEHKHMWDIYSQAIEENKSPRLKDWHGTRAAQQQQRTSQSSLSQSTKFPLILR